MKRDAGRGIALDSADEQTEDTGELAGAKDQSAALAPLYERVRQALDRPAAAPARADQPAAALLADISPGTADALLQQAHAANASRLIGAGSDISLAFQNAPKAFAETGSYSGVIRGPEDFASVFGVEEGGRQFANFDQQVRAGKQAFEMRAMPDRDIKAQLLDAAANAGHSPDGQSRYQVTAAAARQALEARRNDPAGQASKAFPQVNAAWRAVSEQTDPASVQKALAITVAAQHYLGIENVEPVPRSVLKDFGGLPRPELQSRMEGLLAGTNDPEVKVAMARQFADAGLLDEAVPAPGADRFGQDIGGLGLDSGISRDNPGSDHLYSDPSGLAGEGDNAPQLTPDERLGESSPDDLPTDVLLANLSPAVFGKLVQTDGRPNAQGLVNGGADVALASQAARSAVSKRNVYSGPRPSPEQFAAVFGAEEGGRQFKTFKWRADVSPYLAEMRTMSANQIDALLDVDKEKYEQNKPRRDLIAGAAAQILQARQTDPAAYVRDVFPSVEKAWSQVTKPEDYGAAVQRSFAAQRQLGIKNIQPLPRPVAEELIRIWGDSSITPDAEEAERKLLDAVSDPKQRSAVAKQLAGIRTDGAEVPTSAAENQSNPDHGSVSQQAPRQFAKTIDLSASDILRLKKTLMTEWVVKQGDDQAKGIIDTILNRLASEHWGNDIPQVVNSRAQFSDINSINTDPLGRNNVDQLSVNDPRFTRASKMVDEYLVQRANGTSSIVDDNLNYANPNHSSKKNLVWIYKLDGPKFGEHWHGTENELKKYKPGEFGIRLPGDYYQK